MPVLVKANEAVAARRRAYFHLVGTDGITPALGEAGGQPQLSTNGVDWADAGIGTLTASGHGRYYAALTQAAVAAVGDHIETRYKSDATAECPGDTLAVVDYDPYAGASAASAGDGGVLVDHNYPTAGAMTYQTADGVPIDNAEVRAYLRAAYDAGNRGNSFVVATVRTNVLGEWDQAMMLDPGSYVVLFSKQGSYVPARVNLTVS